MATDLAVGPMKNGRDAHQFMIFALTERLLHQVSIQARLDDFVIMVGKLYQGTIYVIEEWEAKSPQPEEWIVKFFEYLVRYRPQCVGCETTLFQRMVKWALTQEMRKIGHCRHPQHLHKMKLKI